MSDNWIVQNLNSALSTWSEKMAELWTLLTENPATFKGGGIWRIMVNIDSHCLWITGIIFRSRNH